MLLTKRAIPDAAVPDLELPDQTGHSVLRSLRARCGPNEPIAIAITAVAPSDAVMRDAGCSASFVKPFDVEELGETIAWLRTRLR